MFLLFHQFQFLNLLPLYILVIVLAVVLCVFLLSVRITIYIISVSIHIHWDRYPKRFNLIQMKIERYSSSSSLSLCWQINQRINYNDSISIVQNKWKGYELYIEGEILKLIKFIISFNYKYFTCTWLLFMFITYRKWGIR